MVDELAISDIDHMRCMRDVKKNWIKICDVLTTPKGSLLDFIISLYIS